MSLAHLIAGSPSHYVSKLVISCSIAACTVCLASPVSLAETVPGKDQRMDWFREARFGLFVHWGVYSVPAGEWKDRKDHGEWIMETGRIPVSEYETFVARFNPVKFDAREWVRLAKEAGMRYLVITSKHHDGFCMFNSQWTQWDIMSTPYHRDPMQDLAGACRDAGIKFCFYYSIMDWHHPDYAQRRAWNDRATGAPNMDRYIQYMKGQLKELLTQYGPLGILWFDGEWEAPWTHQRGVDLYHYVRNLQPGIIVNNRVGKGRAGMEGMDQGQERVGDYGTPEQQIPATGFGPGLDWESCMTMNDHWGYNRFDQNWKSTTILVRNLIDCASKGGNYLLNVGPTAEGLIPGPSVQRLVEIGQWMKPNSEAIHGTTASPFKKLAWGKCTQKPGKLYLHVFDWPADGTLRVPLASPVQGAYLLANKSTRLAVERAPDGQVVRVPSTPPTPHAGVVVLDIPGPPEVLEFRVRQTADGTLALKAMDAELLGRTIRLENKAGGQPNIGFWTDLNDHLRWPVTITKTGRFDVEVEYACDPASAGSDCVLVIGDGRLAATVEATGGWDDFTKETIGQIQISEKGPADVVVKALRKPGLGVVNLRSIVLRPF